MGGSPLADLDTIKQRVLRYAPGADLSVLDRAYAYAERAHSGQKRLSGDPYLSHPTEVALILADLELDVMTIAAGLLHDVVEDTGVGLDDLNREFGSGIARLVDGVTKLSRIEYRSREDEQVENLRKMFLAMSQDIRVLLIRLADRLHNMQTLSYLPPDRQKITAQETLDVFAPLAHRLGTYRMKMELEDLALRHLEPERYKELVGLVSRKRAEREDFTQGIIRTLKEKLAEVGVRADISGRAKHFYSIYRKVYIQGRAFADVYDLIAIRVIVDTIRECYAALGVVHSLWKPIPGRFKDFIAMPKPNMYQSLHTTVISPDGEPFEIQIRTWEMHRTAEYGIAAHWRYKEEGPADPGFDKKLSWLRQLMEWQRDLPDAKEFMESLKVDLFSDEVFVFTPKGDVIGLPAGATPIDFAYRVHTDVGHRCIGAKVNGRLVPLDHTLANGDIVEILTSKQIGGPSWDWLTMAKTAGARQKIRQWFKRERRDEHITRGKELMEKEIRRRGLDREEALRDEWLDAVARRFSLTSVDELYAAVGYGGITAHYVVQKLEEELGREQRRAVLVDLERLQKEIKPVPAYGRPVEGVRVRGLDNALIRFSRCCNPVPGDPIVGYVTRGRGVSVHRVDCPNLRYLSEEKERLIEVAWDKDVPATFSTALVINAFDRPGLLSDVVNTVAETRTNISHVNAHVGRAKTATIDLVVEISSLEQLRHLQERIAKVRDVFSVSRTAGGPGVRA
ncbi:MAG: bifunctional (p)ppGpp synthetase/guanosine-3',5'-bis(diphosphate) 3'-pyrophosphohydrolase [Bacillota bacterium]|nr:MAG: bifunctional (p)ppGpp synthetase/guanosine-3',5'-bis(diphosphate) 3'-pyrophosphohydrolase [Bacillota bacterium]